MSSDEIYKIVIAKQQEIIELLMQTNCEYKKIDTPHLENVGKSRKQIEQFNDFLKYKGYSENTIDSYMFAIKSFFEKYDDITDENLIAYQNDLKEKFKPKTINIRIAAISKYLKFIGYEFEFVRAKEQKKTFCDNVINEQQYNKYVEWCFNNDKLEAWKAAKIISSTGVRVSELIKLKTEDLVKGYVDITSKGNKTRRIYFPQALKKEIEPYCNGTYLIENKYGNPMTTRGVSQLMLSYGEQAGIPRDVMHPHSFRHYFAKQFMKKSDNITLLGDLLGHSDLATTAIYTRQTTEEQKEGINKIIDW